MRVKRGWQSWPARRGRKLVACIIGSLIACTIATSGCAPFFAFDRNRDDLGPGDVDGVTIFQGGSGTEPAQFSKINVVGRHGTTRAQVTGQFTVRSLAEGGWTLRFEYRDSGDARRTARRSVLLEPGPQGPLGEVALPYVLLGDVLLNGPATVQGSVKRPDGSALSGAKVEAKFLERVPTGRDELGALVFEDVVTESAGKAVSDGDGNYILTNIPGGPDEEGRLARIRLIASYEADLGDGTPQLQVHPDEAKIEEVDQDASLDVDLVVRPEAAPAITDPVYVRLDGEPAMGVRVRVAKAGTPPCLVASCDDPNTATVDALDDGSVDIGGEPVVDSRCEQSVLTAEPVDVYIYDEMGNRSAALVGL